MTAPRRVIGVCLSGALVVGPAWADHGSGPRVSAWRRAGAAGLVAGAGGTFECAVDVEAGMVERGTHGVTQFRLRPRLFPAGGGRPAPRVSNMWASSVSDGGWWYSPSFPDDAREHWASSRLRWSVPLGAGEAATAGLRVVGVRPGWWQPDLAVDLVLGQCDPADLPPGPGLS